MANHPLLIGGPLAAAPHLPRILGLVALVLLGVVVLEALMRRFVLHRPTDFRGVAASLGDALVRRSVDLLGLGLAAPLPALAFAHRLFVIPMNSVTAWLGLYLLVEFVYYWHHRVTHRVRWFWATHSVHHSSNQADAGVGDPPGLDRPARRRDRVLQRARLDRLSAAGRVRAGGSRAVLPVLDPRRLAADAGPAGMGAQHAHAPPRPPREQSEYLDCNYGSSLIVFDRLFGTFVALRPDIEIRYGLTHPVLSNNPLRIAFNEWLAMGRAFVAARGAKARMKVLFGPP